MHFENEARVNNLRNVKMKETGEEKSSIKKTNVYYFTKNKVSLIFLNANSNVAN